MYHQNILELIEDDKTFKDLFAPFFDTVDLFVISLVQKKWAELRPTKVATCDKCYNKRFYTNYPRGDKDKLKYMKCGLEAILIKWDYGFSHRSIAFQDYNSYVFTKTPVIKYRHTMLANCYNSINLSSFIERYCSLEDILKFDISGFSSLQRTKRNDVLDHWCEKTGQAKYPIHSVDYKVHPFCVPGYLDKNMEPDLNTLFYQSNSVVKSMKINYSLLDPKNIKGNHKNILWLIKENKVLGLRVSYKTVLNYKADSDRIKGLDYLFDNPDHDSDRVRIVNEFGGFDCCQIMWLVQKKHILFNDKCAKIVFNKACHKRPYQVGNLYLFKNYFTIEHYLLISKLKVRNGKLFALEEVLRDILGLDHDQIHTHANLELSRAWVNFEIKHNYEKNLRKVVYGEAKYVYDKNELVLILTYPLGSKEFKDIPLTKVVCFYLEHSILFTEDDMEYIKKEDAQVYKLVEERGIWLLK